MIRICFFTGTRAEYGILSSLIKKMSLDSIFEIRLLVSGSHLSPEFGLTYKEIENDGISIDEKIEIVMSSDTPAGISKSMGLGLISFSDYFKRKKTDLLFVLGDRYEALSVSLAAMNEKIAIAHIHGGETTEGAIDEAIRHSITKLSYLHFTSTYQYRKRVIQLGENPDRVFMVGALATENIRNMTYLSKEALSKCLKLDLSIKYAMVTFHPVTLEENSTSHQMKEILDSLVSITDMNFIITKSNADANGRIINDLIDSYSNNYKNIYGFSSLGFAKYISCVKHSEMVIGNSSSGIDEAPVLGIPTINIGDRQKGRLQSISILNTRPNKEEILKAIKYARTNDFKKTITASNYKNYNTSDTIISIIKKIFLTDKPNLKKAFYDINFNIEEN